VGRPGPGAKAGAEEFVRGPYGRAAGRLVAIAGGEWSQAYALALDGREVVVRFGSYGEDFAKDAVMGQLGGAWLPIPRVIEVGETPWGFFAVSERAHGVALDSLDGEAMSRAFPSLLEALDAMTSLRVTGATGFGLWRPDGAAPHATWRDALLDIGIDDDNRRTRGWRGMLARSPDAVAAFDRAFDELARLSEALPDARQVIHADLLHDNVLVDGGRVAAVLDWGNSLFGDHLYDSAWLLYWWSWYPAWSGIDLAVELERFWSRRGGMPADYDARLRCYQIHVGLGALAYNAFAGRDQNLPACAERLIGLCRG
jgi:hygromycin-B 4-O-kinase